MNIPPIDNVLALPILGLVLIGSVIPLVIESFHSPPRAQRGKANGGGLRS
jgi:hypothetical protein